jgi:histidinol-phosphate phosphatase family protein
MDNKVSNSQIRKKKFINLEIKFDKSWTIFLDRDGVINEKRENDYIKNWSEFSFTYKARESLAILSTFFDKIIIVTNQRGVGKGIMTENELKLIHEKMLKSIKEKSGRIDKIYYCTDILDSSEFRKPNIGMAIKAKLDFPSIDFRSSIMIGDSESDMIFGKNVGMKCFMINNNKVINEMCHFDKKFESLFECSNFMVSRI